MNQDNILDFLNTIASHSSIYPEPSEQDWRVLEERFGCSFPDTLRFFISKLQNYDFPLEVFRISISSGNPNNATVLMIYEQELECETDGYHWNPQILPIFHVGNGDIIGVECKAGGEFPLYYIYHEDRYTELLAEKFENSLPILESLMLTENTKT
jgi:hypothetical protein